LFQKKSGNETLKLLFIRVSITIFFKTLGIPIPDYNLGIGSGNQGEQTGKMVMALENVLFKEKPDTVLVYGDTNSTLAGALAASKLHIPVAHVEAGLRSFNRKMPEEINRVITDHISSILLCPTVTSVQNLKNEGVTKGVYLVGDVMRDIALSMKNRAEESPIMKKLGVRHREYLLVTMHRPSNTDDRKNLESIVSALIDSDETVIFPVHPRTTKYLKKNGLLSRLKKAKNIILTDPLGYLDFQKLLIHSKKVLTDSGGIQKEAYFFKVPCITLRDDSEWVETINAGWNVLVGAKKDKILSAILRFNPKGKQIATFGSGRTAEKIVRILENTHKKGNKGAYDTNF
jgi:UDP-N-acetylglucosamine 2-epimerase